MTPTVAGWRPDLPTAARDWRLMARTVRLVLGRPAYAALAALAGFLGLTLFVISLNARLAVDVILGGSQPLDARLRVLVNLYPLASETAYAPVETAVLMATAAMIGVNVALLTYHLRESVGDVQGGSGSAAGVVLGTLGAGCAACGSAVLAGVLSLFGAAGLLTAFPLEGLEFALLALAVLVVSLYWLADGMRGATVRGCPVDPPGGEHETGG